MVRVGSDHPLAPPSGVVAECRIVLLEKIGPGQHDCHWCGADVQWKPGRWSDHDALVADHLDWDMHNNDPGNLVPSCRVCNAHRTREGDRRLIEPGELFILAKNGRTRHRAVERNCENCGRTFLAIKALVKRGQARFCTRECAGHGSMPAR